jgi:hypothetical protein
MPMNIQNISQYMTMVFLLIYLLFCRMLRLPEPQFHLVCPNDVKMATYPVIYHLVYFPYFKIGDSMVVVVKNINIAGTAHNDCPVFELQGTFSRIDKSPYGDSVCPLAA